MDERPSVEGSKASGDPDLPDLVPRPLDDLGPEPANRGQLGLGRRIGDDHRTRDPQSPRVPCERLGHVPRAAGEHAAGSFLLAQEGY